MIITDSKLKIIYIIIALVANVKFLASVDDYYSMLNKGDAAYLDSLIESDDDERLEIGRIEEINFDFDCDSGSEEEAEIPFKNHGKVANIIPSNIYNYPASNALLIPVNENLNPKHQQDNPKIVKIVSNESQKSNKSDANLSINYRSSKHIIVSGLGIMVLFATYLFLKKKFKKTKSGTKF